MFGQYLSFGKLYRVFFVLVALYSFSWYVVGQYLKNNAVNVVQKSFNIKSVSYGGIRLEGFPFFFSLNISDLRIALDNEESEISFFTKGAWFSSDLLVRNFEFDLRRKVYITSDNNKINYAVKINQDSNIDFGLTKSMLRKMLFQPNLKMFMEDISYFDSGFDVMDRNTGQIIAVSRYNQLFIKKNYNKAEREALYTIRGEVHSEFGVESLNEFAESHLNLDVVYKVTKMPSDNNIMSFFLGINKMKLNSGEYSVEMKGDLSNNFVTNNASGEIKTSISGLEGFLKTCKVFIGKDKLGNLKKIITKMSSKPKKSDNIADIGFSVSGNEKGITYGRIGGFHRLIAMMQSKDILNTNN